MLFLSFVHNIFMLNFFRILTIKFFSCNASKIFIKLEINSLKIGGEDKFLVKF